MFETRIISISRVSVYVMSLPCLAWLSSVSICLGGISTQLHSGNSHDDNSRLLLQITPVPMESRKLLSMKEWKNSRDLARVEPVQHISLADLTRTKPEPMQISIFSAVPLFGADRSYISLQQMNSGGRTPMICSGRRWCRIPQLRFAVGQPVLVSVMSLARHIFALKILHHNMNGKDMAVVCFSN